MSEDFRAGPSAAEPGRAQPGSSDSPRVRREALFDPDGSSWVPGISIGLCVLLMCLALLALAFQEPGAVKLGKREFRPLAAGLGVTTPPIVEPLGALQALTSPAALGRKQDSELAGGLTREADVVAAGPRPGCFGLEPEGDVCLGPAARVRVGALGQGVELLSGRAVISVERLAGGVSLTVVLGALRVEAKDAALGLALEGDEAVVRVLRGVAALSAGEHASTLQSAQSALYRASTGSLEVLPQLAEKARRDWELLAARTTRH